MDLFVVKLLKNPIDDDGILLKIEDLYLDNKIDKAVN